MLRPLLFAALALAAVCPSAVFAQPEHDDDEMIEQARPEPKADHGEKMLKVLDRQLKLKPDQKKKIEAVIKDSEPEMEKLQKEMESLREKQRKFMRKQHEQVRALLDDDQKDKFDEITVQMRRRMEQMGGGRRGGRPSGPRRRPGPPSEDDDREDMGPRDMPPPEMWHEGPQAQPQQKQ
ncbi:MAG: hypothetical protein HY925_03335 [Elusimicrobia bacterium]|nr:hypothetical protein [Elusimicrobiota bacterium]